MNIMKKIVLLLLLLCIGKSAFHQTNLATLYALPVARMQLDTTAWSFNSHKPNFMQLSGYFINEKQVLEHKQLGLKLSVVVVAWDSTQHFVKDKNDFESMLMCNDKVLHIGGYSFNLFLFDTGKQHSIILRTESGANGIDWAPIMCELLAALEIISPEQMDAVAGYPLAKNTDRTALANARKAELNEVLGDSENILADNLILRDLDYDFTFKRYAEIWDKDSRVHYTNCEIVAQQQLHEGSDDLKWVSNFIDLKENDWKIADRDLLMDKRQIESKDKKIKVKLYDDGDNEGAYYTFLIDPIMEVHGFKIDKQGHCHESILTLDVQAYGYKYDNSVKLEAVRKGWINDEAVSINAYGIDGKTVVITETRNELVNGVIINDFAKIYLMSNEVVMDAPIVYAAPEGYKNNDMLLQMENGKNSKSIIEATLFIKAKVDILYSRFFPSSVAYMELDRRVIQNRQTNILPLKRMYRTFAMVSDFNKNGAVEYFICYAQNGQIVFADMYEAVGDKMIHVENVNQYFDEMAQIPSIYTMLENSASNQINWGASYDRMTRGEYAESEYYGDDYAPVVQEEGYSIMVDDVAVPDYPRDMVYDQPNASKEITEVNKTYTSAQCAQAALFPGGNANLQKFIDSKLIYPNGKRLKKPLTVTVDCIVKTDGRIEVQGATCSQKKSEAHINEAKTLISKMPLWSSAIGQNYELVPMSLSLDIVFEVPDKATKN
jgi:hypothetical protein